ncbi:MAG: hypothetical protein KDA91_03255, partial [Planctomycetaceae bacterium]|nr:hypothetical protein [Planctomycetaceae bacterium]
MTAESIIESVMENGTTEITESFGRIRGTGDRNNPIRRPLEQPISREDFYIAFEIRYCSDAASETDSKSTAVDPEFFVLWLDRIDGGDQATHARGVPNIGIHHADRGPSKDRNVFMVRTDPANTVWSRIEPKNGQWHRVVVR